MTPSKRLLACVLLACSGCGSRPSVTPAHLERAQEELAPFKVQLLSELTRALDEGPVHAIEVCQARAPEIAAATSSASVHMGRTSHRLRNPANAPEAWMQPLLAHYVANPADTEPRAVALGKDRFGYVEPIHLRPLCLPCHGGSLDPAVAAVLRERYPEDQATGFAVDDFRGLFWITMPLMEPRDG